jgi:hypothetical protein
VASRKRIQYPKGPVPPKGPEAPDAIQMRAVALETKIRRDLRLGLGLGAPITVTRARSPKL